MHMVHTPFPQWVTENKELLYYILPQLSFILFIMTKNHTFVLHLVLPVQAATP